MAFGRRTSESHPAQKPSPRSGPAVQAGTPCGSLARVLARVLREPKPEILNLGPLCGDSVVYLAGRGAKVYVEDFDPPPPTPPRSPGEILVERIPIRFDCPDSAIHLVLTWELADFVPPDRLSDLGAELRRVTREGGFVLMFSHARPEKTIEPMARYRLLADDLIVREPCGHLPPRPRWVHPNREIERALAGFSIQGIHLQRSQMREILALRAGVGA